MQNSQTRHTPPFRHLRATDVAELEEAQPEKQRRYVQLEPGPFQAELIVLQSPTVQIFRERMDAGVRVEAAPPRHLVPLGIALAIEGPARFCGVEVVPDTFMQASGGQWDFYSTRAIDYVSCVFDRERFEQAVLDLTGRPARPEWLESRVRSSSPDAVGALARRLARLLGSSALHPPMMSDGVSREIESELVQLAIAGLLGGEEAPSVETAACRRRALLRALELLEEGGEPFPTIPELCRWAGVGQRTLEYAFRDELGVTPVRYLKLLRLNRAHRLLRGASPSKGAVTSIAFACGFTELGRFAVDYRRHFGESPSQTLKRD
jgi:AraC family ethanolamine operon transcriptional activator